MAFDIFMLCLIASGYVLFLVSLLQDAARLLKLSRRRLGISDGPLGQPRPRTASMLQAPPPATDRNRKIKQ